MLFKKGFGGLIREAEEHIAQLDLSRAGDEEKKDRRGNIRFIKHYFPQARIHGIPKMAHAELVMIYPEEFCRYFDKFMCK